MTDPNIIEGKFSVKPGAEVFRFMPPPPLTMAEAIQAIRAIIALACYGIVFVGVGIYALLILFVFIAWLIDPASLR